MLPTRIMRGADAHQLNEERATSTGLEHALATFDKWLHLPDHGPILVVLGCIAANLMEGDPVWLLLVGPPGSGKTEMLQPLAGLPNVHMASTLTEPSLLSGTSRRDRAANSKGGLLRQIGEFGFIACKDFTSILAMHRDARSSLLAAFREIYDGSWIRHVGSDGGQTLSWSGKVAVIAGCTATIDSHHSVMAAMGERFVLYRMPPIDEFEQARRALSHGGKETIMRSELTKSVTDLFRDIDQPSSVALADDEQARLIALTTLAVRCRSAVERDGHTREIELVPDPEAPGRLALALSRLFGGMSAIGVKRYQIWRVLTKVALDCMPALRRKIFEFLYERTKPSNLATIAVALKYPQPTTRRALEDLTAHGVLRRHQQGTGKSDLWDLSPWTRDQCSRAGLSVSEMSDGQR